MASLTLLAHVDRQRRAHLAREIETVRIDVGDHDFARARHLGDWHRHATDRARAGDEHVFADQVERQGGVHSVAERIGTGNDIERDLRIAAPEFGCGTETNSAKPPGRLTPTPFVFGQR